ncbi:MAG: class I SAM-dependent methyltransferase [Spirochaetes bacterium]|nr:class I SAM-dependent methyltransferase [Spirochaetota bacterium]
MNCRLCGNSSLKLYYTQGNENQFRFYKCPACTLVNYDISAGQDQEKYSGEKYIIPEDRTKKQNKDHAASYRFIRRRIKSKGKLLDIGCGNGKLLLLARDDGWNVMGLELSEFLAISIRDRYGIDVAFSNFLTYDPGVNREYDFQVLRHVLEHLPDSVTAMTKINSLLKPGGYALLEFPDIEGLENKIKRFLLHTGFIKKKYKNSYRPGHCNEFCWESFEYLLNKTGFDLLEWQNYSSKSFLNIIYKYMNCGTKARALIKKKTKI